MRWWFTVVVKRRSQELFMLNLLLVTLGVAWITERAGLSLALGAFVAGMLISETEYKHQVEEDIKPFRDVLLGLFFITIGMLLDVQPGARQLVAGAAAAGRAGAAQVRADRRCWPRLSARPTGVALRTGLELAQAGEFGFVLLNLAGRLELIDAVPDPARCWPSMVLSMLAAPFIICYSDRIVMKLVGQRMDDAVAAADATSRSARWPRKST